jgi:uncharacterized membrane protein
MASPKQARAASGQAKSGGTATRSGSGNPGRSGKPGGAGPARDGRAQDGRAQGNRGPGGRGGVQVAESSAAKAAQQQDATPRWIQLTALVLSLAGLGVSIYLTIVHFGSKNILICSANGTIDCEKVLTSSQAMVFGVFPVAVLGLAFYVFMVAINSPWAWRSPLPIIWWARLAGAVTGMGFVLYLIYAELIQIGNICLWCTSVHVITFLLFVLLVFTATLGRPASAQAAR